jgi:5-methylcytosine-specific restriction endonuclease McrA
MKSNWEDNKFTDEQRKEFAFVKTCFDCGKGGDLELHHIFGRVSNSVFNAYPICRKCHQKGNVGSWEQGKLKFLDTFEFLHREHYKPNKKDIKFLEDVIGEMNLSKEIEKILNN